MPIFGIFTENNSELDLFTGSGANDEIPATLVQDDEDETPLDLTGMTLKFQLLSAEYSDFDSYADTDVILDAKDVDVVGDPADGSVTLDFTGSNITDSYIQRNAVIMIYDTAANNKPVALGLCNIRPGKRTASP